MNLFAIRHKATGVLMPETKGQYSQWDPSEPDLYNPPRFWTTKIGATNAASAWARGIWGQITSTESEGWEYRSYTTISEPCVIKVTDRKFTDLEIVEVKAEIMP